MPKQPIFKAPHVATARRVACLLVGDAAPSEVAEQLWAALGAHSPAVEREEASPLTFYLDATGVAPRYGSEDGWGQAVLSEARAVGLADVWLGLAGNKFAAWAAARTAEPGGLCVVSEPEARFLAPLPVDWLPLTEETLRRLRVLGLHTLGRLAALPAVAVAEQFGAESLTAWRWARGQDERPVQGRRCQAFSATGRFEIPETRQQGLEEAAVRLAKRALRDLSVDRRAWALRRVALEALTAEGEALTHSAWLGEAPGPQTLRALLQRMVAHLHSEESEGIAALTVSLWGLEPAPGRQLTLLEAQESDLHWRQVVQSLQRKYPHDLVRPVLAHPDAPILTERYALQAWSS